MELCGVARGVFLTVIANETLGEINACKSNHCTMTQVPAEI